MSSPDGSKAKRQIVSSCIKKSTWADAMVVKNRLRDTLWSLRVHKAVGIIIYPGTGLRLGGSILLWGQRREMCASCCEVGDMVIRSALTLFCGFVSISPLLGYSLRGYRNYFLLPLSNSI
ncbi:hypothetical protein K469DRAFT_212258 [Zopfia rhizophila CBS 207.26]|uniref:Uncharacterized protein n=1 Tax=Zopfia rhizophila CBS 207.26 TaxID=1314779 RepID=A0A6A6DXP3_9PEZI|nr:hypothetical protein K469DRAFT_212258 [Zopfia rhizophila CBS 207.26]